MSKMADADRDKLGVKTVLAIVVLGLLVGAALMLRDRRQPTVESESGDRSAEPGRGGALGGSGAPAREVLNADTVQWRDLFGLALPVTDAGPRRLANGLATGFERSEAGAALAGIHIMYRVEAGPGPAVFEPTIREQVVGADKARLLLNAQNRYQEAKISEAPGPNGEVLERYREAQRVQTTVWGYRVDAYTPESASVGVLLRTMNAGGPVYANFDLTMRWIEGDWRLVAPVNGELQTALHILEQVPPGYVLLGRGDG
ncbi:MAG TPA: hypothetical protein VM754_10040 [Actinomycetota bacterium]|nr:hypothetical protein [Actinomycetota bacterium]